MYYINKVRNKEKLYYSRPQLHFFLLYLIVAYVIHAYGKIPLVCD